MIHIYVYNTSIPLVAYFLPAAKKCLSRSTCKTLVGGALNKSSMTNGRSAIHVCDV